MGDEAALAAGGDRLLKIDRCDVSPPEEVSVATARGGTLFVETDGSVCPTGFPFKVHQMEGAL